MEHYVHLRVRRDVEGRVYGAWQIVHHNGGGRGHVGGSEEVKPVLEAWEEARDHALGHGVGLIYVEDHDCVFDAVRLGLTRDPDNDCSGAS